MNVCIGRANVLVQPRGEIVFDSDAIAAFDFREVTSVALVYSVPAQRLCIRPVSGIEAGSAVSRSKSRMQIEDVGDFLKHLRLVGSRGRRCPARLDRQTGIVVVQMG